MDRVRGALVAVAAIAAYLAPAAADADPSTDAVKASIDASDYPAAEEAIKKALASGTNDPDTMVELYRLQGIVAGALGQTQGATDAFLRALSLSSKVTLPLGMAPKIVKPYEAAVNFYRTNSPLKIKIETEAKPPAAIIFVQSDPLKLVAKARVTFSVDGGAEQTREGSGKIELPAGDRLDLRVSALDASGNRLVDIGSSDVPIVIVSGSAVKKPKTVTKTSKTPVTSPVVTEKLPLYRQWWVWGGGAVALAGLGSVFGISAVIAAGDLDDLHAASPNYSYDTASELQSSAETRVLLTNISYGLAVGCGITAGVMWLIAPKQTSEQRLTVTPAPLPGGGAVMLGGQF